MVVPHRHLATFGDLAIEELTEIGVLIQRAEAALFEAHNRTASTSASILASRRGRRARSSARAHRARVERRYQFHDRGRRDARAAGKHRCAPNASDPSSSGFPAPDPSSTRLRERHLFCGTRIRHNRTSTDTNDGNYRIDNFSATLPRRLLEFATRNRALDPRLRRHHRY